MPTADGTPTESEYAAIELAKAIGRFINRHEDKEAGRAFAETIVYSEHRTLQQGIMRTLIVPLLAEWARADEADIFDLRNQATVEFAHDLIDAYKELKGGNFWPPALHLGLDTWHPARYNERRKEPHDQVPHL
jgi:hypothetical protein